MKIAVIGAGALGTLFGGALAASENEVWLLHHRPTYADELSQNGVRIESDILPESPVTVDVSATTDASAVGAVDLAVVLVRSHQTRDALREHRACIGPDTRVLSLQNGLTNYEVLCSVVGEDRALAGVTYQGADLLSPGVVRHTGAGATTLGGIDAAFSCRISNMFEAALLGDVKVVNDPRPYIWDKQMVSIAFKPLAALTRLRNGQLVADDACVALMDRLINEAKTVAEARGIPILTDDVVEKVVALGSNRPEHRSSMLQDVLAGRKTEIDEITGAIAEYADQEDIDAPYNEMVTALIRGLERSYLTEG